VERPSRAVHHSLHVVPRCVFLSLPPRPIYASKTWCLDVESSLESVPPKRGEETEVSVRKLFGLANEKNCTHPPLNCCDTNMEEGSCQQSDVLKQCK
jgi:hypothetical protein